MTYRGSRSPVSRYVTRIGVAVLLGALCLLLVVNMQAALLGGARKPEASASLEPKPLQGNDAAPITSVAPQSSPRNTEAPLTLPSQPNEVDVRDAFEKIQHDMKLSLDQRVAAMRDTLQQAMRQRRARMEREDLNVVDLHRKREANVLAAIDQLEHPRPRKRSEFGGHRDEVPSVHIDEEIARRFEERRQVMERLLAERKEEEDKLRNLVDANPHRGLAADRDAVAGAHRDELRHKFHEELRKTSFGIGGLLARRAGRAMRDATDGSTPQEELSAEVATSHLQLVVMTTLKSCSNESVRYAQLDAVMSWVSLPMYPAPRVVLLGRTIPGDTEEEECSRWVAERVNRRHKEVFGEETIDVVRLMPNAKSGPHGTILLGSAMREVEQQYPEGDVYALINADILLDPLTSLGLHKIASTYTAYFVVGRRRSVSIPLQDRFSYRMEKTSVAVGQPEDGSVDVSLPGWSMAPVFAASHVDRQDAEDFFFWSKGFFASGNNIEEVPDFHIGRPAYDNWLVHHAIHSWRPVVDGTELIPAYHQAHSYEHLQRGGEGNIASQDGGAGRSGTAVRDKTTYWGGEEQKENYRLGVEHGGWQHGLIDFAPLGFAPRGCSDIVQQDVQRQVRHVRSGRNVAETRLHRGKMLFDWYAHAVTTETDPHRQRGAGECSLRLRADWKPLEGDDTSTFKTLEDYQRLYAGFTKKHKSSPPQHVTEK